MTHVEHRFGDREASRLSGRAERTSRLCSGSAIEENLKWQFHGDESVRRIDD